MRDWFFDKKDLLIVSTIFLLLLLIFYTAPLVRNSYLGFTIDTSSFYKHFFYSWSEILQLGESNLWNQSYLFPFGFFYYFLSLISNNPHLIQAIFFSVILTAGYCFFLIFLKNEFKTDSIYLHLGSIFYVFNIYTIAIIQQTFFVFIFSFFALPLQLFFLNRLLYSQRFFGYSFGFALATLFMGGANPPLIALNLLVIVFYSVHLFLDESFSSKEAGIRIGFTLLITVLLSFFWISSVLAHFVTDSDNLKTILSEPLSMHAQSSSYLNVFRSMSLWSFHSNWLGEPYFDFAPVMLSNPFFYFSTIIPILIFFVSLVMKRSTNKILWIASLLALVIPMTVAINQGFLANAYQWLYDSLPGFAMFRTTFKFTSLYIFCLSYSLVFFMQNFVKGNLKRFLGLLILGIILVNAYPFFDGQIVPTSKSINSLPNHYMDAEKFFSQDSSSHRILLLPPQYFAIFDWGYPRDNPEIIWGESLVTRQAGSLIQKSNNLSDQVYQNLFDGNYSFVDNSLTKLNVKYIVQRNDFDWKFYPQISKDPDTVREALSRYRKIETFGELDIYEVDSSILSSLISSPSSSFQKVNPTKYHIEISSISSWQDLTFLESYHEGWKLYLVKHPTDKWCEPIEFYENTNTTECEHTQKFSEGEELSYLWKEPIFDDRHKMVYDYANGWTIDAKYIKENYPKEYYTENPDGSIDMELVMYFKPQSYFYIGLLISGLTLISCIGYLAYDWKRNRNKKKNYGVKI